ncbi:hypothetical protein I7I48_01121 [Histoplasma ohiense]|nr:hypothetical protein I7I48_01121 [Histoplasma ohiense (nom. inval.)]
MSFTPVNQPVQDLVNEEYVAAGPATEENTTEDVAMEPSAHGLEPGSCVRCLKSIGDVPLCVCEVAFKNCKRYHNNRSHCDPISLLK